MFQKKIFTSSQLLLNGKPYTKNWLQHNEIFSGNAELVFEMGNTPNIKWGSSKDDLPPSMSEE